MLIINPSYDVAFKCLLQNNKLAKYLLGLLLETNILELEIQPQEVPITISGKEEEQSLSILRLDFKATILDEKEERKLVLIELQKLKNEADLFRFRKYLGLQYLDKKNTTNDTSPLPIVTIYFLGFRLQPHQNIPVLKVERSYRDLSTKEILSGKNPFIEVLSHDMILIQMLAIKKRKRFDIEKILSIFDSKGGTFIEVDEQDYPEHGKEILHYLHDMMKDPIVVKDLEYERVFNEEIQQLRDKRNKVIKKLEERIEEEKKQKEEERKQKEEERKQKETLIKTAVKNMRHKGLEISEIAAILDITAEQVQRYLP